MTEGSVPEIKIRILADRFELIAPRRSSDSSLGTMTPLPGRHPFRSVRRDLIPAWLMRLRRWYLWHRKEEPTPHKVSYFVYSGWRNEIVEGPREGK